MSFSWDGNSSRNHLDFGLHVDVQYLNPHYMGSDDCSGLSSLEQMLQYSPTKVIANRSRVLTTPDTDESDSSVPQPTSLVENESSGNDLLLHTLESPFSGRSLHFSSFSDTESYPFQYKDPARNIEFSAFSAEYDIYQTGPERKLDARREMRDYETDLVKHGDSVELESKAQYLTETLGPRTDFQSERFDSQSEKGDKPRSKKYFAKKLSKSSISIDDSNVFDPNSDALHPDMVNSEFSSNLAPLETKLMEKKLKVEEGKKTKRKKKEPTTQRKKRKVTAQKKTSDEEGTIADGKQSSCCIKECTNPVNNRMRQCLRCKTDDDWKEDFIQKGWDKICNYHYFADLYEHKKRIKQK